MKLGAVPWNLVNVFKMNIFDHHINMNELKIEDTINTLSEMGYKHFEIDANIRYMMEPASWNSFLTLFTEVVERNGGTWALKFPSYMMDLVSPNELVRKASVETIIQIIKETIQFFPVEYVVENLSILNELVHSLHGRTDWKNEYEYAYMVLLFHSLEDVLTRTELNSENISLVNPIFPEKLLMEFISSELNVKLALDPTNLILSGINLLEFFDMNFSKISRIYLKDLTVKEGGKFVQVLETKNMINLESNMICWLDLVRYIEKNQFNGILVSEGTFSVHYHNMQLLKDIFGFEKFNSVI